MAAAQRFIGLVTLAVSCSLLLAACAAPSKAWSKPGTTAEQFGRDNYSCAQKHSHEGSVKKELYRSCMTSLGYLRVDGGQFPGVGD